MTIPHFDNREQLEAFVVQACGVQTDTILIKGSTAHADPGEFGDVDVEAYGSASFTPIYKFVLFQDKIVLVTIFFMGASTGSTCAPPSTVKVLRGEYVTSMQEATFNEGTRESYQPHEWVARKRQVVVDELFKYLRHRDEALLEDIEKKLNY